MCTPKRETILRRSDAGNYLYKKCDYYPCHSELETCNTCFCLFYPCEDPAHGEYVKSSRGGKVWSCMNCNWTHREETVNKIREFLKEKERRSLKPREMYIAFIRQLETGGSL